MYYFIARDCISGATHANSTNYEFGIKTKKFQWNCVLSLSKFRWIIRIIIRSLEEIIIKDVRKQSKIFFSTLIFNLNILFDII